MGLTMGLNMGLLLHINEELLTSPHRPQFHLVNQAHLVSTTATKS